jgi:hypothetical protein
MFSQSILGRPETQHGENPHDGESFSDPKLLPMHQRTLEFRGDCQGVGTTEESGQAF